VEGHAGNVESWILQFELRKNRHFFISSAVSFIIRNSSVVLFNSWSFLILLVATFALYHVPVPGLRRKTWQVGLLLAASAVFYAWEEPRLLLLLGASCVVNAVAVERILFHKSKEQGDARREGEAGDEQRDARREPKT
jgi:hypothetical protein